MKYTIATALLLASIEALCDEDCTWNEAKNDYGPSECWDSCECSGKRGCSAWGFCEGVSGCPPSPAGGDPCSYDEIKNP